MNSVLRAFLIYGFLFVALRLSGKRTLAQVTPFDLVLLLIISEAVQNGMTQNDLSLTNSIVLVTTLVLLDIGISFLKRNHRIGRVIESAPLIVVQNGEPLAERMAATRITEDDVLEAARMSHGLERMDQVKHAVLEPDGEISIIPRRRD
jgi:uncharacterized membrane protein YcaP (DUF421 family)